MQLPGSTACSRDLLEAARLVLVGIYLPEKLYIVYI